MPNELNIKAITVILERRLAKSFLGVVLIRETV
jgi:hypothetical protein